MWMTAALIVGDTYVPLAFLAGVVNVEFNLKTGDVLPFSSRNRMPNVYVAPSEKH